MTLLSIRETARLLGVSGTLTHLWCQSGYLPSQRVGRVYTIRADDLPAFRAKLAQRVRLRKPGPGRPRKSVTLVGPAAASAATPSEPPVSS